MPHEYNLRVRKRVQPPAPINDGEAITKKRKASPVKPPAPINDGEAITKKRKASPVKPPAPINDGEAITKKRKASPVEPPTPINDGDTMTKKPKVEPETHVLTFGSDIAGEMGLGEIGLSKKLPCKIKSITETITQVASGAMHTLCLTKDGKVYTFGCNDEMALGRKTNGDEALDSTPTEISLLDKVTKITAGDSHSAALTAKGHVYIWGNFKDEHGSVGLTPECEGKATVEPIRLMKEVNFKDIASGSNHMLLLDTKGMVYSFGVADQGQLGRFDAEDIKQIKADNRELYLRPTLVDLSKVDPQRPFVCDAVFAGNFSSFAINTDKKKNRLAGWGLNNYQQLGYKGSKGQLVQYFPKRSTFTCSTSMKYVASGQHHTLFLTTNGRVYSAGRPEYGRLGLGKTNDVTCPAKCIESLKNEKVVDVSVGTSTSYAVTEEGKLYSWGMAGTNLGMKQDEEDVLIPTEVVGKQLEGKHITNVSAGSSYTVLLACDKSEK